MRKIILRYLLLLLIFNCILDVGQCDATEDLFQIERMSTPQKYPSDAMIAMFNDSVKDYYLYWYKSQLLTLGKNTHYIAASNKNGEQITMTPEEISMGGIYDHTASMPLTKFVFGMAEIDVKVMFQLNHAINDIKNKNISEATFYVTRIILDEAEKAHADNMDKMIKGAVTAFKWIQQQLPLMILVLMFFIQMFMYVVAKLMASDKAAMTNPGLLCFRFAVFMFLLIFWRPTVMWLIDFANLAAISVATIVEQKTIINQIIANFLLENAFSSVSGLLEETVKTICGWITQIVILISIITRDVMLAISVLIGPVCLSLGYYMSLTGDNNVFGEYLAGWVSNFFKLMIWGIFTAMMIITLGLQTAFATLGTGVGNIDVITSVVTSLCFLYAAMNIPTYSERMSGALMISLLALIPAAISSPAQQTGNMAAKQTGYMAAYGTGKLASKTAKYAKERISKLAALIRRREQDQGKKT